MHSFHVCDFVVDDDSDFEVELVDRKQVILQIYVPMYVFFSHLVIFCV